MPSRSHPSMQVSKLLTDAKADLAKLLPHEAELKCLDALVRCEELADKRATRATLRLAVRLARFHAASVMRLHAEIKYMSSGCRQGLSGS
jgi:hypothetical protein